jgi:hypothetical protein
MEKRCYLCGSMQGQHVHHIDWHHEHNARENRITVCQRCHTLLHQVGYLSVEELEAVREQVMTRDPKRFIQEDSAEGQLWLL